MSLSVLQAKNVVAGYVPDMPILHGVSIHVGPSEIVSIIGPNGAGKSTLIKAIAGLVLVKEGDIRFNEKDITNESAHHLTASGVAFVPQTGNVFSTLSIHENLVMGGISLSKSKANERIEAIYKLYPFLSDRQREKAGVLSGGQRQILAVARALITEPRLMLLDEPTAGLSPMAANELFGQIQNLVHGGVAIVMVEQNAKAALRISDRAYILAEGQNRFDGKAHQMLEDEEIGKIFLGLGRDLKSGKNLKDIV